MDARSSRVAARLEPFLLTAAVLTIPSTIVEESRIRHPWPEVATWVNWTIWLVFLAEVVVMLAVVPARRRWLREHPLELAIVVLTTPPLLTAVQPIRMLRLLRVFRLMRLAPLVRYAFSLEGLRFAAILAALTAVAGGAAFAAVENLPVGDGIYWAVTTMTTVGYGDFSPRTTEGRVVAVVVMLVGIGTATLFIGAVAERFMADRVRGEAQEIEAQEQAVLASDRDLLTQVREIAERLTSLEAAIRREYGRPEQ